MRIGLWEDTSRSGAQQAGRFASLLHTLPDVETIRLHQKLPSAEALDAVIVCASLPARIEWLRKGSAAG